MKLSGSAGFGCKIERADANYFNLHFPFPVLYGQNGSNGNCHCDDMTSLPINKTSKVHWVSHLICIGFQCLKHIFDALQVLDARPKLFHTAEMRCDEGRVDMKKMALCYAMWYACREDWKQILNTSTTITHTFWGVWWKWKDINCYVEIKTSWGKI